MSVLLGLHNKTNTKYFETGICVRSLKECLNENDDVAEELHIFAISSQMYFVVIVVVVRFFRVIRALRTKSMQLLYAARRKDNMYPNLINIINMSSVPKW